MVDNTSAEKNIESAPPEIGITHLFMRVKEYFSQQVTLSKLKAQLFLRRLATLGLLILILSAIIVSSWGLLMSALLFWLLAHHLLIYTSLFIVAAINLALILPCCWLFQRTLKRLWLFNSCQRLIYSQD